jgi:hypothetical protein
MCIAFHSFLQKLNVSKNITEHSTIDFTQNAIKASYSELFHSSSEEKEKYSSKFLSFFLKSLYKCRKYVLILAFSKKYDRLLKVIIPSENAYPMAYPMDIY